MKYTELIITSDMGKLSKQKREFAESYIQRLLSLKGNKDWYKSDLLIKLNDFYKVGFNVFKIKYSEKVVYTDDDNLDDKVRSIMEDYRKLIRVPLGYSYITHPVSTISIRVSKEDYRTGLSKEYTDKLKALGFTDIHYGRINMLA